MASKESIIKDEEAKAQTEHVEKEIFTENDFEGSLCFKTLKVGRIIQSDGHVNPATSKTNYINNKKYNFITFIPLILYNQFRFFYNLYFLMLCVTQFVPQFKVGFLITYIAPLVFVISLTMLKEGWDDYKRYLRDKKFNEHLYRVYNQKKKRMENKKSEDLIVGDILLLDKGDRVPADLLILGTKQSAGVIYLKTDQLDGETDWKIRESLKTFQAALNSGTDFDGINFSISIPRPSNKIYEFRGKANFPPKQEPEPLKLQHTAWASTTVASGEFYGLVIYVGRDTRIQMNANAARIKFPICDFEINSISKFLFFFCLFCSFFLIMLKGFPGHGRWIIEWVQFLVLLCCIIPQSLRINLDIVKLVYASRINSDKYIDGTICRNSQMTEDLGRVNFLLSDKTGTLTQNEMIFKKLTTGLMQFSEDDFDELNRMIKDINPLTSEKLSKKTQDISMLVYCLALCHNVTPCFDTDGERFLQSSSPDEIALVTQVETMGFKVEHRDRDTIMLKEPSTGDEVNKYTILENFPFSSARKRMGIVLRIEKTGKLIYMLKGADTTIRDKVERNADMVVEEADNLAREGLRTLAFCYKYVTETEYEDWKKRYLEVTSSLHASEEDEDRVISELELGMKFVGISGVEDLLQDSIRETIESLREAYIKVWVLTGDKVETAKCIAKSTGLKQKQENFFDMLDEDLIKIENQINQIANKKEVLVIQGNVLSRIFESGQDETFFRSIHHLNAIMFCRCSPTQKALITKSVQKICNGVVCSIGDGGNDVSMIQQADVGVGIEGKEGLQAAMSSDFSILKFKYVKDLLFWHGRRATMSTAYVTLFVMHRGLIIAMIQFCFSLYFYFVTVPFYNAYLIIAYTVVYLVLPVVVLSTVADVTRFHAMTYPKLYYTTQQSQDLKMTHFLMNFWKSLYQASAIFLLSCVMVENSFLKIVTISFSSLVIIELLNIVTMVDRINRWIVGANLISFFLFVLSVAFFRRFLDLHPIDFEMCKAITSIVLVCWIPFELIKLINKTFFPSVSDKIMLTAKKDLRVVELHQDAAAGDLLSHKNSNSEEL